MCTKNNDRMIYGSWEIVRKGRTNGQSKRHIELGAPHKMGNDKTVYKTVKFLKIFQNQ